MVAGPEVLPAVAAPGPEVLSAVAASGLQVAPAVAAPGPEVVSVVAASGPEVVFAAVVAIADVAELRASVDIAVAFAVLVPVSVVVAEVDSSGRPRLLSFPNVVYFSSPSSSDEVVGEKSVHSSIGARSNYGLCSILSNPDLYQNKNLEHCYNNPSHGYNNVSDTNDLPMDATTSHSRKRGLHQCQEQRKHRSYQVSLSHLVVRQIRWRGD